MVALCIRPGPAELLPNWIDERQPPRLPGADPDGRRLLRQLVPPGDVDPADVLDVRPVGVVLQADGAQGRLLHVTPPLRAMSRVLARHPLMSPPRGRRRR